jgi:hypothetical protein
MRIAIVNKKLDTQPENHKEWLKTLEDKLKGKGHEVALAAEIVGLPYPLQHYDMAISHPSLEDARTLALEIKRRQEFRWLIHSIDSPYEDIPEIRESPQVRAYFSLSSDKFVEFVQTGW